MTPEDISYIEPGLRHLAVPISELKPYPNQTNTHDECNLAAIARSLRVHGQKKSLVANKQGEVIAGWGTVLAAQQLGWTHLAVVFSDEDEQGLAEYHIEDNRTAELAKRDEQKLLQELSRLETLGTGPDELGWTQEDMAALAALGGRENSQDIPSPIGEQKTMDGYNSSGYENCSPDPLPSYGAEGYNPINHRRVILVFDGAEEEQWLSSRLPIDLSSNKIIYAVKDLIGEKQG